MIYNDAQTLRALGLTHAQVADKLEYLVTNPNAPHGCKFSTKTWRGAQEDPFQEGLNSSSHSSVDFTITNSEGAEIKFPGLLIKLIRNYQFFEGKGTSYRLDPREAVRLLRIEPAEKYPFSQSRPVTPSNKSKIVYRGE